MGPEGSEATRREGPEAALSQAEQGVARNANRARWWEPLEPVPLVMTPAAIAAREARRLWKQREDYERDSALSIADDENPMWRRAG